jgi:hypothetical protein
VLHRLGHGGKERLTVERLPEACVRRAPALQRRVGEVMTGHEDDRQAMRAPTMQCFACHQASNTHDGRVPGAPNWHLAPLSMGWEDLHTDKALCEALKDPSRNGDKDVKHLVEHMTLDALVQWAWSPGTRVPPTVSQDNFHRVVRLWARTGAACPRE